MALLDRFLDAIKLNDDDYDDDDEFLDDDDDLDSGIDDGAKPKGRFFKKFDEDDDDLDDLEEDRPDRKTSAIKSKPAPEEEKPRSRFRSDTREKDKDKAARRSNKVTPIRKKPGSPSMEVNVIRPTSMEDTRDIADMLLDSSTVVLNLEGLDLDTAQRIIDFTCGACYSLDASLQKISSYIFILTPADVDISGDFEDIIGSSVDLTSYKSSY